MNIYARFRAKACSDAEGLEKGSHVPERDEMNGGEDHQSRDQLP